MKGVNLRHKKFGSAVVRQVLSERTPPHLEVDLTDIRLEKQVFSISDFIDPETGCTFVLPERTEPNPPQKAREETAPPPWYEARSAIAALRLGQCPHGYLEHLTVGMRAVMEGIDWALERSRQGLLTALIFRSEYGKGKTHALTALAHNAGSRGCLCSKVVLDGYFITLTRPMELLGEVVARAMVSADQQKEPQTLCETLRSRCKSINLQIAGAALLHEALQQITPEMVMNPDVWEVFEDYLECSIAASPASRAIRDILENRCVVRLPAINVRARAERPEQCAAMLREWSRAAKPLGSAGGLAVLFDEADVDYALNPSSSAEESRHRLFQALAELGSEPGGCPLLLGFAVTPGSDGDDPAEEIVGFLGSELCRVVDLSELSKPDFLELAEKIDVVYAAAYPNQKIHESKTEQAAKAIVDELSDSPEGLVPRHFIRRFVDYLDVDSLQK